ncbi:hypothetical protein EST38_g6903 [Candolleomyces aberdarensis]|uniref:Uncharacterized protein n=1 Tax=Candolleomyces aberdarensis TaxID=2316362 RepID=A0A4Q2DJG0_9AGAR|nr:hypothetical protein EST38_g6903 [Candolleomyces aberdarensis]
MGAVEMGINPQLVDSLVPLVVMEEAEEEKTTTSPTVPAAPPLQQDRSSAAPAAVALYAGSVLKENKENVRGAGAGRGRKMAATLSSPPSGEEAAEEEGEKEDAPPRPAQTTTNANIILTGNALVAHGRKVTPFDPGIGGLSINASFAIPPGTFNVTTPSAVSSSSRLGVSVSGDEHGDALPADWGLSIEMPAKTISKGKNRLRIKIVHEISEFDERVEYFSTLELDIAERD